METSTTIQNEIKKDYKSLKKQYTKLFETGEETFNTREINDIIENCDLLKQKSFYYNTSIYMSVELILKSIKEIY
jgi:hypothetical protein